MKRVTLLDIAKIAGVSHVTVSMALRDHPRISKKTRERIQEIAKELGYRPDPVLSALIAYRRNVNQPANQGVLAWINNYRKPEFEHIGFREYLAGARERSEEIGYKVEEFRLVDLDMSFKKLSTILRARNIQGLLFSPQERKNSHISSLSFNWEYFSAVTFGFTLVRPHLHVVTDTQFRSARLAVQKLRSLGYRRIGCVTARSFDERTDGNFLGGFLVEQLRFSASDRIPVFWFPEKGEPDAKFMEWRQAYQPDAIFDPTTTLCGLPAFAPGERNGCALAIVNASLHGEQYAGIGQNNPLIGRVAVDLVVAMIHANQRGIPSVPQRVLIEGQWVDGPSAPRVTGNRLKSAH